MTFSNAHFTPPRAPLPWIQDRPVSTASLISSSVIPRSRCLALAWCAKNHCSIFGGIDTQQTGFRPTVWTLGALLPNNFPKSAYRFGRILAVITAARHEKRLNQSGLKRTATAEKAMTRLFRVTSRRTKCLKTWTWATCAFWSPAYRQGLGRWTAPSPAAVPKLSAPRGIWNKATAATEQVRAQAANGGGLELVELDLASLAAVRFAPTSWFPLARLSIWSSATLASWPARRATLPTRPGSTGTVVDLASVKEGLRCRDARAAIRPLVRRTLARKAASSSSRPKTVFFTILHRYRPWYRSALDALPGRAWSVLPFDCGRLKISQYRFPLVANSLCPVFKFRIPRSKVPAEHAGWLGMLGYDLATDFLSWTR